MGCRRITNGKSWWGPPCHVLSKNIFKIKQHNMCLFWKQSASYLLTCIIKISRKIKCHWNMKLVIITKGNSFQVTECLSDKCFFFKSSATEFLISHFLHCCHHSFQFHKTGFQDVKMRRREQKHSAPNTYYVSFIIGFCTGWLAPTVFPQLVWNQFFLLIYFFMHIIPTHTGSVL